MPAINNRKSRWSPRTIIPVSDAMGVRLPYVMQATMLTAEQQEAFTTHLRISEISGILRQADTQLRSSTYITNPQRSHSKAWSNPEYDAAGRRINSPMQCYRRHLERERHRLVKEMTTVFPGYQLPRDYRRPTTFTEQVFMPPKHEYPGINFVGQVLGPRGASLRELQECTGTSIRIRGEGSVKEGKEWQAKRQKVASSMQPGRDNNHHQYQPLHVLITADEPNKVNNAKMFIQKIFDDAISKPDWQNDRKLKQIRDLAIANGTFRDDESYGRTRHIGRSQLTAAPGPFPAKNNETDAKPLQTDKQGSSNLPPWRKRRQEETQDLTPAEIDLEVDQWLQDLRDGGR